jgi:deazaflavin-dependent oxidoreductase (nitroreductase family)
MSQPRLQRRGSPKGLQRILFRAPIGLYRVGLGFLLGRRFLMLEHVGRKSGEIRRTVVEVVLDDEHAVYIASGWGSSAQWFRNIEANPSVVFHLGNKRYATTAVIVEQAEAGRVMDSYADAHPKALGRLASFMLDDPGETVEVQARRVAETIPMVRLSKMG